MASKPRTQPCLEHSGTTGADSHAVLTTEQAWAGPSARPRRPRCRGKQGTDRARGGRARSDAKQAPALDSPAWDVVRTGSPPPGAPPRPQPKPTPDGLAAALGLRTVAGLARFIPSPAPRCRWPPRCQPRRKPAPGPPSPFIHSFAPGLSGLRPAGARAETAARGDSGRPRMPASDRPDGELRRRQPGPTNYGPPALARGSLHDRPGTGSRRHRPQQPTSGATGSKTAPQGREGGDGPATAACCLRRPLAAGGRPGAEPSSTC